VLRALRSAGVGDVRCLTRRPDVLVASPEWNVTWQCVSGDLHEPRQYARAIPSGGAIIHLAGAVGKRRAADFQRENVDATLTLVSAAREAGAGHLLFASSIAATYPDDGSSPYARSKRDAERVVSTSGLSWTILRPTMVFGAGSANLAALSRLARLPVPVIIGDGQVEVQPVDVDDLAGVIHEASRERWAGEMIEVGGPDRVTMEVLLRVLRKSAGRSPRRPLHLPLMVIRRVLLTTEPLLLSLQPFTAGQLAAFAYPSVAQPSARMEQRVSAFRSLSAMVAAA
jgi:NADH dehydrogenase